MESKMSVENLQEQKDYLATCVFSNEKDREIWNWFCLDSDQKDKRVTFSNDNKAEKAEEFKSMLTEDLIDQFWIYYEKIDGQHAWHLDCITADI